MDPKIEMIKNETQDGTLPSLFTSERFKNVKRCHQVLKSYSPTPLIELTNAAQNLGVKSIYIKDESKRFGLNSFKGLGAIYAISKIMRRYPKDKRPIFVTATDGNHGKAIAWAANLYECQAVVFMPRGSKQCRVEAIESFDNARVEVTNSSYDDTVRFARDYAQTNDHYLVQDTALEDYSKIPNDIILGYSTMVSEALTEMQGIDPTHVFLQAGVGSMAAGVLGYLKHYYREDLPHVSIMEAQSAACFYQSIENDKIMAINNDEATIMAGLDCKEPNFIMFPFLKDNVKAFFSCPDWVTKLGMKKLAKPHQGDTSIEAGESGAIGFGLLNCLMKLKFYQDYRDQLALNGESVILLFNTEGYTDDENCQKILKGLI